MEEVLLNVKLAFVRVSGAFTITWLLPLTSTVVPLK
jgi:hypothetical protein